MAASPRSRISLQETPFMSSLSTLPLSAVAAPSNPPSIVGNNAGFIGSNQTGRDAFTSTQLSNNGGGAGCCGGFFGEAALALLGCCVIAPALAVGGVIYAGFRMLKGGKKNAESNGDDE